MPTVTVLQTNFTIYNHEYSINIVNFTQFFSHTLSNMVIILKSLDNYCLKFQQFSRNFSNSNFQLDCSFLELLSTLIRQRLHYYVHGSSSYRTCKCPHWRLSLIAAAAM